MYKKKWMPLLGGGFKYCFIFTPTKGEDSHFDEHTFQMGGSTTPFPGLHRVGWSFVLKMSAKT